MNIELLDAPTAEVLEAYARLMPQLAPDYGAPTPQELAEMLASPALSLFAARSAGRIVGLCALVTFRTPAGRHAWLEDVVVDAAARGQGIGEALTRAAIERARASGARSIDLTSRPEREAANRLYLRLGFELRRTNLYRLRL